MSTPWRRRRFLPTQSDAKANVAHMRAQLPRKPPPCSAGRAARVLSGSPRHHWVWGIKFVKVRRLQSWRHNISKSKFGSIQAPHRVQRPMAADCAAMPRGGAQTLKASASRDIACSVAAHQPGRTHTRRTLLTFEHARSRCTAHFDSRTPIEWKDEAL